MHVLLVMAGEQQGASVPSNQQVAECQQQQQICAAAHPQQQDPPQVDDSLSEVASEAFANVMGKSIKKVLKKFK